ncbi:cyclin-dependent kinase-like 4 isoform X2 [Tribolium madens]|uniref:cyclin-dependent kinase-like 4 isoform X2 n=1 Tax=Tribolium madens TaxID=41895 RepID=UPI001CF75958|nr:cyclin-dependent kinase-like 4 isoform X2 [Tribolium madens]
MDKYEQISVVGEGSYGLVMKCRHKETDQIVAIKKFLETEEDATIRKMALREIRMLKRLKHENLVTMIEVFRHRKRFFLVFEFLEGTVLDELEKMPGGLGDERCRERIYQVTRAINYCHSNNIIHRDVKPENVLVSSLGVVKLCDFGFARLVCISGEPCTEYVATRWYRAPELLVGESNYGAPVDIWAIGCLFAEMMTGDPLFPGESDIDQLYLIVKMLGKPCHRHQHLMSRSSHLRGMIKSASSEPDFGKLFPNWSLFALEFLATCMKMDPHERSTSEELLKNSYFTHDRFPQKFLPALREKVNTEFNNNPLLRKYKTEILMSTDKKEETKRRGGDQIKWRFSLAEGSIKRKYSYDIFNESDKNLISLSKTSQRLNVVQKSGQKPNNSSKEKDKKPSGSNAEMQMLEKSLESLVKFSERPVSARKEPESPLPPSPPQFQSLQQFSDFSKSPNVLHPSINNISFNKDFPKKSPNLLQSLTVKSNLNQVPLLTNPRTQFLKKIPGESSVTDPWVGFSKKKEQKARNDVFTLPNLPGATGSPNKNRKKSEAELLQSNITVTPRIQSSTSQKLSPSKNSSSFPMM